MAFSRRFFPSDKLARGAPSRSKWLGLEEQLNRHSRLSRAVAGPMWRPRALSILFCLAAAVLLTLARMSLAQPSDAVRTIDAENRTLAKQNEDVSTAVDLATAELATLEQRKRDLVERLERIERRAEVQAIGQELARTLVQMLRQIPGPDHFDRARQARSAVITETSDANLRAEQALRELQNLDAAVQERLAKTQPAPPPAARPDLEGAVRGALLEQRNLLTRLIERQHALFTALHNIAEAEDELDRRHLAAHAKLTEILYWVPARPGAQTLSEVPAALAWITSPSNWSAAADALVQQTARRPVWPAAAVLLATLLLLARARLQHALVALAPAAVTPMHYGIGHALAALACTLALAAPAPIVMWTVATLLGEAAATNQFVPSLGDALSVTWRLLLALSAFAWLADSRGLAVSHFGADAAAMTFTARALRRFRTLFVPLIFLTALTGTNNVPWAHRESLGRLLFVVAMVVMAAFLAHLLRRKRPLIENIFARAPRSLAAGTHTIWMALLVALPLAIAALATIGYFVVAAYFFSRMLLSSFLVLGALALYGLMALWVQMQHFHLALRQRQETARLEAQAAADAGSDIADVPLPRVDIAALGEQSRSLLDLCVTALLLVGLWWVWRDALQNLAVVGEHPLWSVTDTVGAKDVVRRLTLNRLVLALIVIVITAVVVRNIGALLDITLLQRFDMKPDATYAIKVIARYAFAAAGVVVVSRILSIDWSDAQWLVAALGVGLGFGLQEIVANFVSGLIVLAERPIRIGDTITVGTITGKVLGIKARATVVVDSESREVIIPNKALITERVINWTLSDQTSRLLLKIRVAEGSDVALAQQVLLDTVRSHPEVMQTPAATAFFAGFGDSSLDFEIRAFVDSLEKRLRVQHDLYAAIETALRQHGIGIPFPQRDTYLHTAPAAAGGPNNRPAR